MIPLARPCMNKEEIEAVKEVFASGWLGMGSMVFNFEQSLKNFLGVRNVIAVNTGTSALHIALDAMNLKVGDEVLVPSFTFVATIQSIISCKLKPTFCDINKDTLNIDIEDLKKKITCRSKIIMPVHYGGVPCDMDELLHIAKENKMRVIEDAAHAFGSFYRGKKIGSFGDVTCFSFDPIKNITCGEGGAVVTNDDELASNILKKRILGIDKDTWSRYKHKRSWFYQVVTEGYRYHMSNINAAIGLIQIKKIDKFLERKREICKLYDSGFSKIKEISLIKRNYREVAPFNYVIKVKEKRDSLMGYLKKHGIDSGIHYIPNHLQPLFRKFYSPLPNTEDVFKEIISLPLYVDMRKEDVQKVIETVTKYFES